MTYDRVVVDTNVLLSAALSPKNLPAQLVDRLLASGQLVFSERTYAEFEARIWRPKFDRYLTLERRRAILLHIHAHAHWVEIPVSMVEHQFSCDGDDDAFIHVALTGNLTRLISGDSDLLCLHPLNELHILTPRQAWDELEGLSAMTNMA